MTIEGFIGIYQPLTGIYSDLSYLCMTYLGGILGFVQLIYICVFSTTGDANNQSLFPGDLYTHYVWIMLDSYYIFDV